MRRIVATTYMTLDGVIKDPHEWSGPYFDDDAGTYSTERLFASDALLLGRKTYQGFAEAWPTMTEEGDFGKKMNSITTYVVSSRLKKAEWNDATIIRPSALVEEVSKLKKQDGQDILIYGVGRLAHTLLKEGLLDELEIWIHPVLVGNTDPDAQLIRKGSTASLELTRTRTTGSGVLVLTYAPVKEK
ncbi:MAG TPA: dihydrofolate reductase family protein [Actinophytocola sp.]|uniref:dihydrofolate reductase family protein n=1 Tax=Actinophytocola sp. TaxID=1872138 RepID=UPI002DDD9379|nr:dihydrofolate reductase family protein [Actinophytocola sp.]HEV2780620.1 dihydrofolate reductase family protein [Actinophytocola sp.]